jgi:hypothetical protein
VRTVRTLRWLGAVALATTVIGRAPAGTAATGRVGAACAAAPGSWAIVASPNAGTHPSTLDGVAAVSASEGHAVGSSLAPRAGVFPTLIERCDGSVWRVVNAPSVGSNDNTLYGVTAVGPNDGWAVGAYSVPRLQTPILWNGSKWKVVTGPNLGYGDNIVYDVAPTGRSGELRAVGSAFDAEGDTVPLALRWNGSTWKVTSIPGPVPGFDALFGIAAAAPGDLWAVGDRGGFGHPFRTLAEHWDGSAWTIERTRNRGARDTHLYDIAHVPGTGDFWAAGTSTASGGARRTLIERLDC